MTVPKVKAKQTRRSNRAKSADSAQTAKRTFASLDKEGRKKWLKNPERYDISGVDTKGAKFTKSGVQRVSIRPSKAR